jgi:PAS domain S-box-containing protein
MLIMDFDIRTVLLLLFLVSALLAVMLLIYWKTQKTYEGFSLWAWASVVVSLAYLLITLRGTIPEFFSIILANLLVITSILMRLDGMSRFMRSQKILPMAYAVLLPVFLLLLYFTYGTDSVAIRGLIVSTVIVPGLLLIGVVLLSSGEPEGRYLHYAFAASLGFYALLYALRTANWMSFAPSTVFSNDQLNGIFFMITLLMDILAAGFFLMLNMARSRSDLAASEDRYRTLSDNLPDYIVVHNGRTVRYANPATLQFTGIPEDRIVGMPIDMFIAPESLQESRDTIDRLFANPASVGSHEITIRAPEGSNHICIVRSVPIRFGGERAVLSVLTDITERKKMEDSLRTVNRKLNLLSGMTRHDIRNQLMALGGFLEISRETVDNQAKILEFIDREKQITRNIAEQIEFTKDYEDLGVTSPVWQFVETVVRDAAASLPVKNIRFEVSCPGLEMYADPLLRKVFYNLIDNSLRYGGAGLSVIRVSAEKMDSFMVILFEDNGTGITADDKKRLFTKGFGKNTGLGLFLSREILSITGISISEDGEPGQGARFRITVPNGAYRFEERPGS